MKQILIILYCAIILPSSVLAILNQYYPGKSCPSNQYSLNIKAKIENQSELYQQFEYLILMIKGKIDKMSILLNDDKIFDKFLLRIKISNNRMLINQNVLDSINNQFDHVHKTLTSFKTSLENDEIPVEYSSKLYSARERGIMTVYYIDDFDGGYPDDNSGNIQNSVINLKYEFQKLKGLDHKNEESEILEEFANLSKILEGKLEQAFENEINVKRLILSKIDDNISQIFQNQLKYQLQEQQKIENLKLDITNYNNTIYNGQKIIDDKLRTLNKIEEEYQIIKQQQEKGKLTKSNNIVEMDIIVLQEMYNKKFNNMNYQTSIKLFNQKEAYHKQKEELNAKRAELDHQRILLQKEYETLSFFQRLWRWLIRSDPILEVTTKINDLEVDLNSLEKSNKDLIKAINAGHLIQINALSILHENYEDLLKNKRITLYDIKLRELSKEKELLQSEIEILKEQIVPNLNEIGFLEKNVSNMKKELEYTSMGFEQMLKAKKEERERLNKEINSLENDRIKNEMMDCYKYLNEFLELIGTFVKNVFEYSYELRITIQAIKQVIDDISTIVEEIKDSIEIFENYQLTSEDFTRDDINQWINANFANESDLKKLYSIPISIANCKVDILTYLGIDDPYKAKKWFNFCKMYSEKIKQQKKKKISLAKLNNIISIFEPKNNCDQVQLMSN